MAMEYKIVIPPDMGGGGGGALDACLDKRHTTYTLQTDVHDSASNIKYIGRIGY